jgi:L-threonylcarbamoyladenylate synthase
VIEEAVAAIRAGDLVVLPTDTVYGLCAEPTEAAAMRVARLKGRESGQPTALLAQSVEALVELVPELPEDVVRALLPGAYTLIVPNPARRFRWLTGDRPEAIGVRVPRLPAPAASVVEAAGPVLATSANLHGRKDPPRVDDVPDEIRSACGAVVDAGELPGTPSTVLDLTGEEPRVLREGAVSAAEALAAADRLRE